MKISRLKTILALIAVLTYVATAKAQDKRFTGYLITDPVATTKDGFNVGLGIEYQTTIFYIKTQVFLFPDLRGKDYVDYTSAIGLNYHSFWNTWRLYTGLKGGVIKRDRLPHPTWGGELGVDYYFKGSSDGFYIGIQLSKDRRTDGKIWDNDIKPYWRNSGFIKIGYSF